ncbi:MAG TPA: bifunctional proline dehydrogenase/L-glutamate gamma-semialdehyde dehydrogenase PutA, partial [Paracoccaceae bacterium]|nr:bifunctional proline dehydrogenase/L-glutamate gamma-semialdehyde dehydrogenase PutA [Paracoccaceae bacterium]
RYLGAYAGAIAHLAAGTKSPDIRRNPGISVKLSALHPRYEYTQRRHVLPELSARVLQLARAAAEGRMGFNIDAEEADRLDLSLDVIEDVLADPALAGWDGFGVVVQAYGKRAAHLLDWLHALAEKLDRRIMVRLVKGAYWDSEIKRAQVLGLDGFPVFTRKAHTDVSFIACARKLLAMSDRIYPQFATHNAHSVAAILAMADEMAIGREAFEFQRLHGMGEALHEEVMAEAGTHCRIYAPVGAHRDLLAYLVRRLLENGANSSFVHQITDESVSVEKIARDPFDVLEKTRGEPNPNIARGPDIFRPFHGNSRGWDVTDPLVVEALSDAREKFRHHQWEAGNPALPARPMQNPAELRDIVGHVHEAGRQEIDAAFAAASQAQPGVEALGPDARAEILERAAVLYEENAAELMALASREAGKNWQDAIDEVREACDFLRYYASMARRLDAHPARGVFACISPWNFPLAIFTGQIAAALVTGNAVLAKPAEQTPLIAARAVALLHEAGVPGEVLHLLPGDGPGVGAPLTALPGLGGVAFTGSGEAARQIARQLAETSPEAALIAETGGLNAMLVDSTALPEQAVRDILASAFQSAGQRCSALRVLYLQRDVEERFLEMLFGAMETLRVEDPWEISTDIGPLIDSDAHREIAAYCTKMEGEGRLLHRVDAPAKGHFLGPAVLRVRGIEEMEREIFGPVLHVASFNAEEIGEVIDAINAKGYGLTFGLHTRVDARVQEIVDQVRCGNIYVNRNQIGAVVGAQPFGGEGLSGTGPKAGGPLYLRAFMRGEKRVEPPGTTGMRTDRKGLSPESETPGAFTRTRVTPEQISEAFARLPTPTMAFHERIEALRSALGGRADAAINAAAALDPEPTELSGPTGESNRYMLVPRGPVLALGPGEALLCQAVQALAAGNKVIAIGPEARQLTAPLAEGALPFHAIDGIFMPEDAASLPVAILAWAGEEETARRLRQALSTFAGPIARLVRAVIAPWEYHYERSICIDTTATGGNTALLAGTE